MALKSGLNAQFGMVEEGTYGTYVAPTRFLDFVSESFSYEVQRVESSAIRAGTRVMRSEDWQPGNKVVSGDIEFELWNKSFGLLLQGMMGGSASTTTGTGGLYTHEWTPGDLTSATYQVGVPNVTGGVTPWSFTGVLVNEWELSAAVGDPVKVRTSVVAQDSTTSESLETASYASGVELLTFVGASLTVSGNSTCVRSLSIQGNNGLNADRFCLGRTTTKEPLEGSMREYTGSFEAEFEDLTLYNLYVNGTEASLVATFAGVTNSTHQLVVTANVRFDGERPAVGGTDIVMNPMSFKVVDDGSTSIKFEYTTTDSAA